MALPEDERKFQKILREYNKHQCPGCGKRITLGDCAWNWACTEYGTDYNVTEIQCQACLTEIANYRDWYPSTDYPEKFYEILEEHLEKEKNDEIQRQRYLAFIFKIGG